MENGKMCTCAHHKVVPACIVLIGLAFLLLQWNVLTAGAVGIIWPILLIVIGGTKMYKCGCC
ncbi:MAG: hypothetical protein ABSA74_01590 [Candidatus Staskawiczbacteria bacterium]